MKKLQFIVLKNTGRNIFREKIGCQLRILFYANNILCHRITLSNDLMIRMKEERIYFGSVIKPRLKLDAVPSVFPNLPSYLTKSKHKERSQKTTSCSRTKLEQEHREHVDKEKLNKNMVKKH